MLRQIIVAITYIIVIVILISCKYESLLEFFYIFHKKVIIIIGILLIGKELYEILEWLFIKKKTTSLKDIIYRLIAGSIIFAGILVVDSLTLEKVVKPKLSKLEVVSPKTGDEVANLTADIKVFVRAVEGQSIYIIVKTPQGTLWMQDELFPRQFKDDLDGRVRLGEGERGIGETFEIFAIATNQDLPIGILSKVPEDAIWSNKVKVKRVG